MTGEACGKNGLVKAKIKIWPRPFSATLDGPATAREAAIAMHLTPEVERRLAEAVAKLTIPLMIDRDGRVVVLSEAP